MISKPDKKTKTRVGSRRLAERGPHIDREITEYYNALIRNLRLRNYLSQDRVALGVCSAPGCGTASVVASNLAICMASSTERNLLYVNADPMNRVPDVVFRSESRPAGVYDVLLNDLPVQEAIHESHIPNLFTIGPGVATDEITSVSCMVRFRSMLDQLRDEFSLVLVGLPVASELTPCFDMATELDGVIVEFESDRVKRSVAKSTIDQLNSAGANLLGCVFKQLS